ncbi:MAG: hypothetical protein Q7J15_09665 [Candidatus Desulfaltia sp.]|nr:hypothetical protein [Candidatus Desulfaltia sp.]
MTNKESQAVEYKQSWRNGCLKAVTYVKKKTEITNREYQNINTVSNKTAYLELLNLVKKDIFKVLGKGKSVSYKLKVTEK